MIYVRLSLIFACIKIISKIKKPAVSFLENSETFIKLEDIFAKFFGDMISKDLAELSTASLSDYSSKIDVSKCSVRAFSSDLPYSTKEKIAKNVQNNLFPPEWILMIPKEIREISKNFSIPEKDRCLADLNLSHSDLALSWLAVKYPETLKTFDMTEKLSSGKFMSVEALYRVGNLLSSEQQADSVRKAFENRVSTDSDPIRELRNTVLALGQRDQNVRQSSKSPLGLTIKKIINEEINENVTGRDLFTGINGISKGLGWKYTDFMQEFDRWLNFNDADNFQFDLNFSELTQAGFDKASLLEVPFYPNMSQNMVESKIHIHK